MRIVLAQINPILGDLKYNREKIIQYIERARKEKANLILFPELALCGYPPEDLLYIPSFVEAVEDELRIIAKATKNITALVGTVRQNPSKGEKPLFNTVAILENGEIKGFQDKTLLPEYDVFSEGRYFEPASRCDVWSICDKRVGITICEDIWQYMGGVGYTFYNKDPVKELKPSKPDFLLNISSSPYYFNRLDTRLHLCEKVAKALHCPVAYCNLIGGNDSLIFDGYSLYFDSKGQLLKHGKGFEEDFLVIDTEQPQTPIVLAPDPIEDLYKALVLGVKDYFKKVGFKKACLGLSGGIDSAVVACIAVEALGKENLLSIGLSSRFTTPSSVTDSEILVKQLGIEFKHISIEDPYKSFLSLLEPEFQNLPFDITEENLQSRIRAVILMAFCNKFGYLLLSTGNKSELAMGYSTLYGDMSGGLAVLSDVTKQQVYELARHINRHQEIIPQQIIDKEPSAELRYNQKDTDTLPKYPIVDAVLSGYIEEHKSPEEISNEKNIPLSLVKSLIRRIHLNEYKRRQSPPGLRVTKRAFTVGRRFPIAQHWNI